MKPDKTSQTILSNQSAHNEVVYVIDAVLLPVTLATVVDILTAEYEKLIIIRYQRTIL